MSEARQLRSAERYQFTTEEKAAGATYTPKVLADFVADKIIAIAAELPTHRRIRILDPAIGHGELLVSLLKGLANRSNLAIEVHGFETNREALATATARIEQQFPNASLHFRPDNFLTFVLKHCGYGGQSNLFNSAAPAAYDLIIANPPYVRTQIMGAAQAQLLARQFGLSGRVDMYYAFMLGISHVLEPKGIAGIIVSNRFMTTKSGAAVRQALLERFNIRHVWDLGDTKLFDAAVLPAVLLVENRNGHAPKPPAFTSIYQTTEPIRQRATDPISALTEEGVVGIDDGRRFHVRHGKLDTSGTFNGVWRIATKDADTWLTAVESHSWGTFGDIGKIRVGVKTCADKVFVRNDWHSMPEAGRPELLKPLTTHHIARRFKPLIAEKPTKILYPHEVSNGRRRAVDLAQYPRSKAYLNTHRATLERRRYVTEAGREWYEIWVPQDPNAWQRPKLVFRDIANEPTFWIDLDGSVVNGDCYWLTCQNPEQTDLLWIAAAVGNSTFIERFYDYRFHNKLYAGRRRFITQYVEKFPLPAPQTILGRKIVAHAKRIYENITSPDVVHLQRELDAMIWESFGLVIEEIGR
ncbi:MAG: N-6 DNA methylase [Bacteroidetes bacterium SB0662_bin_6]|nr:N-6 DNA methylase [Bacteroidetes bacterium SB0668_bin_1]MYE03930.1 N-6 DNA methylase [Bacteroidetes bacterium SB0662_bin_6]